jgi:hypothetical protein
MTERRPAKRPGAGPVIWVSVMLFAGLFAFLTYRFAAGQDPSLAGASAPQPVKVRKVIKRRVITTIVPTPGADTVTSGPVSSSSYGSEAIATSAS